LILYSPHQNEDLYEGHLAEAELSYDPSTHVFRRDKLLESTSMVRLVLSQARARLIHSHSVAGALNNHFPLDASLGLTQVMSPVDLTTPDFARFPRFANARPLSCEIRRGDVLYLPSFWWHEVRSKPDAFHRNIAVNYWYTPVLDKEFPCAGCRLYVNPRYYDELSRLQAGTHV